jgi:5-methylcytosine-specific restriction endonuclease McrA
MLRYGSEQTTTALGIRMKHPIGLPCYYNKGDRKAVTRKVKQAVYAKMQSIGNVCPLCGQPILPIDKVHIDHILPVRFGGTNDPSNLQVVHEICNLTKG